MFCCKYVLMPAFNRLSVYLGYQTTRSSVYNGTIPDPLLVVLRVRQKGFLSDLEKMIY